jgi:hypothetical protein
MVIGGYRMVDMGPNATGYKTKNKKTSGVLASARTPGSWGLMCWISLSSESSYPFPPGRTHPHITKVIIGTLHGLRIIW